MSTTVTLQLNATDVAGDWATRTAGEARTGTGPFGDPLARPVSRRTDELAVYMNELRGAVEAIRQDVHSPSIAETHTSRADIDWATPALYRGMRFVLDFV
ncbi:MAG: hypothetical protein ABI200_07615 [Gaiellales bacterium]